MALVFIVGPYLKFEVSSIILFSASVAISDYLRSIILTGFPWNLWAYSTSSLTEILQIINVIGLYSYNLILITLFTLPIILFHQKGVIKNVIIILSTVIFISSLFIYGNYKINKNNKLLKTIDEKVLVRIVSPNFDLKYNLSKSNIEERFKKIIRYSEPNKNQKTIFIWPEGVFSGYSYKEVIQFKDLILKNFSKKHQIIFGTNRIDEGSGRFYNSMLIVNNNFDIIKSYNKRKLVPFGEFLPFDNFLKRLGFKKITEGYDSFL